VVAAAASFVYALPSLGLFGLGHAFSVIFGWEPWVGALLFGGATLAYTLAGGLLADALTDTVQFVMMCVTLGLALPVVMQQVGGFAYVESALGPAYFSPLGTIPVWLAVVYASTGLVVFVEPSFYQRVFAASSARAVRRAILIGILLWAAYDWCATAGGMLAAAAERKGLLAAGFHPNEALLRVVAFALPAGLTGVFMAGVLACEMSTIDSYCLVAGGNVAYDIVRPLWRPRALPDELLRWTRAGIVLSWVLGFAVAFLFARLLALWVFLATVLTATTLVPVGVALALRRPLPPAAGLSAAMSGLAASIAYYAAVSWFGAYRDEIGTFVWTIDLAGRPAELRQEYAMLVSLPLSALGFAAGALADRWKRARS
jgi:SSS family solute:Na+ symporter